MAMHITTTRTIRTEGMLNPNLWTFTLQRINVYNHVNTSLKQ
jgi:hypothetical protein